MLIAAMGLGWALGAHAVAAFPLIPYIIALMLFITFLGIRPRDMRLRRSHWLLLALQVGSSALAYALGRLLTDEVTAIALLYCVMTPAATAGPVIVRLLSGDVGYTTTYVLLSHLALVLTAPLVLPAVSSGGGATADFWAESLSILGSVSLLIVPALLGAWGLRALWPPIVRLTEIRLLSFGLWLASLVLLMAQTAVGLVQQSAHGADVGAMALVALVTCAVQFVLGQYLGRRLVGDEVAIRHSFAQKNTTLAIWLATMCLPPVIALASAAYILCQNLVITFLLGRQRTG